MSKLDAVPTQEALKSYPSQRASQAGAGEKSALAQSRQPLAEQGPAQRRRGQLKGLFVVGPEFFEPLPDDELALWEGHGD
jgi:hypothetical protein